MKSSTKLKKKIFSITIADCDVETFRCQGNGGQNVNKRETVVRITHRPSGAVGYSCDEREQRKNKELAWSRMGRSSKFQAWGKMEAARLAGRPSVDEMVDKSLIPANLKTEVKDEKGRWVKACEEELTA